MRVAPVDTDESAPGRAGRHRVFLFDLDQTLLRANGAGGAAFAYAFRTVLGDDTALHGIEYAGRTDRGILTEALDRAGVSPAEQGDVRQCIVQRVCEALPDCLRTADARTLPGSQSVLAALSEEPNVTLGMGTGNLRATALIKVAHVGLSPWLHDGGFGDDHTQRHGMIADAAAALCPPDRDADVVVIGDTALDVAAARSNGFASVGVATGGATRATLQACGADAVLADLRDTEHVLRVLRTVRFPG